MADVMRLTDNGNTVDFSPIPGYDIPEKRSRSKHHALDGTLYMYEWGNKSRYEVPVSNISASDYADILSWWQGLTLIEFYPDLIDNPSSYDNVRIVNEDRPLQLMFITWNSKYEGTLILEQGD